MNIDYLKVYKILFILEFPILKAYLLNYEDY